MAHACRSLKVMARLYWGLRELIYPQVHRRWTSSSRNCHEASVNLPYIFLVYNKEKGTIQTIQPNFLIFPGPESGFPPKWSFSWTHWGSTPSVQANYLSSFFQARLCPSMSSPWLLPCMSKSSVTAPGFYWAYAQQRNFPSFSIWEFGTWSAAPQGELPVLSED